MTELPYQVNKARLAEKIADLVKTGKIKDIADLKDESSRPCAACAWWST